MQANEGLLNLTASPELKGSVNLSKLVSSDIYGSRSNYLERITRK